MKKEFKKRLRVTDDNLALLIEQVDTLELIVLDLGKSKADRIIPEKTNIETFNEIRTKLYEITTLINEYERNL